MPPGLAWRRSIFCGESACYAKWEIELLSRMRGQGRHPTHPFLLCGIPNAAWLRYMIHGTELPCLPLLSASAGARIMCMHEVGDSTAAFSSSRGLLVALLIYPESGRHDDGQHAQFDVRQHRGRRVLVRVGESWDNHVARCCRHITLTLRERESGWQSGATMNTSSRSCDCVSYSVIGTWTRWAYDAMRKRVDLRDDTSRLL